MDKIIPSFKESLFNDSYEMIGDLVETGIDSILNDDVAKDIPIVSTLIGITKVAQNLHDRNLLRQTLQFIKEFNEGTIDKEKLESYRNKINNDSKKAEEELGRVLIILNSTIELEKSKLLANLYRNYILEKISWDEFCEFSEIIRMLFISDLDYLNKIYAGTLKDTSNFPLYPFDRLSSLGLINTSMKGMHPTINNGTRTDKYINLSKIGGKFYQSINR